MPAIAELRGQGAQTFQRRPIAIADHHHGIIQPQHFLDTLDRQRGLVVQPGQRAAAHRGHGQRRDLHSRQVDVHAVLRAAVDLGGNVEPRR